MAFSHCGPFISESFQHVRTKRKANAYTHLAATERRYITNQRNQFIWRKSFEHSYTINVSKFTYRLVCDFGLYAVRPKITDQRTYVQGIYFARILDAELIGKENMKFPLHRQKLGEKSAHSRFFYTLIEGSWDNTHSKPVWQGSILSKTSETHQSYMTDGFLFFSFLSVYTVQLLQTAGQQSQNTSWLDINAFIHKWRTL